MIKVVIDRDIPFLEGLLEPYAQVTQLEGRAISAADVRDADALVIRTRTRCDARLLQGSRVKTVVTATIGTDHIDSRWCRDNGIEVFNAAGCNARGVLQWVAAVLVQSVHGRGLDPRQLTLGVVGVGNVGSLVERYARIWGFNVICCDPPREEREHCGFLPVEEIFRRADIVTLHVPLDDSTYHLADSRMLSLRKGGMLINASRGEVADTRALADSDKLLALDVWENEPRIDRTLAERALTATPHIAGYSLQGKANASAAAVEILARKYSLPLAGWYPRGVKRTVPQPIAWQELCSSIASHYDIEADSHALKSHPERFEELRNGYRYREEYF